jgi:hypothetical protein
MILFSYNDIHNFHFISLKDTKMFVSNNMFGCTEIKMLGWAMFVPTC